MARRLFIGDLHGCADELQDLLDQFGFVAESDSLYSVGDIVGKGPKPQQSLKLLQKLRARVVLGNHDAFCVEAAKIPPTLRSEAQTRYIHSLGDMEDQKGWIKYLRSWPLFIEEPDCILVHAGLEPKVEHLAQMRPEILLNIRTWDGKGDDLKSPENPPWFEQVTPSKPVIFGHWAKRGLVDLPLFKGLDTGCVYGKQLTGFCPEENRFYQSPARQAYAALKSK